MADIPVPQTNQQQTATQGVDILNELLKQRNTLSEGISGLTKAATVPVAGSGPGTSPQIALPSVNPFTPTPLIDRETVGAHSTKAKGISNMIIASANIVGQYKEKEEKEKQRVLAVDLERVFQAQDGIREAQQTLQIDPNNAEAKGVIAKNQNIIDAMMSDPKRRKSFEKALDISFTDPSKNDQMEHGALQQASKSYSAQLDAKVPQQMQPNVIAKQKMDIMIQQQQSIDKMVQSIIPAVVREQGANVRAQMSDATRRDIAQGQIDSRKAIADFTGNIHYKAVMDSAALRSNAMLRGVAMRNQQSAENLTRTLDSRMDLLNQRLNDPVSQLKIVGTNLKDIAAYSKSLTDQNEQLRKQQLQLATLFKGGMVSKEDYNSKSSAITAMTDANDATLKKLESMHTQGASYIENLSRGLQSGNSTTSAGESESVQTVGPEEDTDNSEIVNPDNY